MNYEENENIEDIEALEDKEPIPVHKASRPEDFPSPLYQLKLEYSNETVYAVLPAGLVVKPNDYVITPTRYGNDIAKFCGTVKCPLNSSPDEVVTVIRKTTAEDIFLLEENLKKEGFTVYHREGYTTGRWILLDAGETIVHIFVSDDREYYGLEQVWADVPRLKVAGE